MLKTIAGLLSFWSGAALIAMLVFQATPVTGPVVAAAGSAFVAGWLVHLCLLLLVVDALAGRLPLALALVPVLAYGGYYVAYWDQGRYVEKRANELRSSNPGVIFPFDDKTYSLVMDGADVFAASHDIRVAYSRDKSYQPDEYVSFRLLPSEQIERIAKNGAPKFQILSVFWNNANQPNVRELRIPERPAGRIVAVAVHDSPGMGWSDRNIGESETSITLEGKPVGVFKSAYVRRLPKFPFVTVGCDFVEQREPIHGTPPNVDRQRFDDPVSVMLGIKVLSDETIAKLPDDPGFGEVAARAPPPAEARDANAAVAALRAILAGQSPSLTRDMNFAIASDPSRLAPLAPSMAKRFVELNRPDASEIPGRREQAELLAVGLAALNRADFAAIAEPLAPVLRADAAAQDYPALYLRIADVGAAAFPFYRDRFLSHDSSRGERLLASLALCRIGQGDGELISSLKSQWSLSDPTGKRDNNYKAALFVALLSLGQADYARKAPKSDSSLLNSWYAALLSGEGRTEAGPNNCMPLEWPADGSAPANLMPSLRWSQREWVASER
jgi:hypothetical protein